MEIKVPAGTKILLGKPAYPMDRALFKSIADRSVKSSRRIFRNDAAS